MEILIVLGGILVFALGAGIVWTGFHRRRLRIVAENHGWTYLRAQPPQRGTVVTRHVRYGIRGPGWTYAICLAQPVATLPNTPTARVLQTLWATDHGGAPGIVLCVLLSPGQAPSPERAAAQVKALLNTPDVPDLTRAEDAPGLAFYATDPAQAAAVRDSVSAALTAYVGDDPAARPAILLHPGGVIVAVEAAITAPARVERLIALGAAVAGL